MRRKTIVLVAAIAADTFSVAGTAPGALGATQAPCGTFTGPVWTYVNPMATPPEQKVMKWKLTARGVKCSFAKRTALAMHRAVDERLERCLLVSAPDQHRPILIDRAGET